MTAPEACIAVVEDDPGVLDSLKHLLESYGYRVLSFQSAVALLQAGGLNDLDCLISDIGMPLMDGLELQRRVGLMRPDLPVILITGRHDPVQVQTNAANNRGIFRKPIDPTRLMAAVAAAIGRP